MSNIKISIVIPVYNVERYIGKCLDSILKQSLKEIEVICVEDCSNDNSYAILKKYALLDSRIIIKNNKSNKGLSASRNNGVNIAKGEYIIFVDSDDYISQNMLENLYNKSKAQDTDILFFGFNEYSLNKRDNVVFKWKEYYPHTMTGKDFFCKSLEDENITVTSWSAIYNNKFLKDNKLSFKEGLINEDVLYFYEVLMRAKRVSSISECYYHYIRRENSISLSDKNIQRNIWSMSYIINKIINYNILDKDYKLRLCENKYNKLWLDFIKKNYEKLKFFDFNKYPITPEVDMIIQIVNISYYNGYFPYKLPKNIVEKILSFQKVVIYGAGKIGAGLYDLLKEYNVKIDAFVVSECDCEKQIDNIKVCQIDSIVDKENTLVLVAIKQKYANELYDYAKKLNFKNIINMSIYV